ncbi:uncharacterized protein KY384_002999 [Bacidia gigantensis]|uniref:uncharacterized protein n=1 Tax=Bacidia gigantensis TaxID=2732470 RepID=UPI001D0588A8|nr:uncharacterized protein KY384_002999 [Bacidia gigantensis]KAG8531370.1 hypothetical protein KY384_002999 [Bacidia gigantensis]
MFLLHTTEFKLHEFIGSDIPKYAILSHTWGDDEVLYRDIWKSQLPFNESAGVKKIRGACAQAQRDDWQYIWIDTCCINKESSAELSEAINSMYAWYKAAEVCYVYLADVPTVEFADSRWFTRGWTLQELLAPSRLNFYASDWSFIGSPGSSSVYENNSMTQISVATGISGFLLASHQKASIAQKMSWMANRETKRGEDMVYCLLGLFGVNMPLLYGEGEKKAFQRLQLEIINKLSTDQSIFAWTNPNIWSSGLLAQSLRDFAGSSSIRNVSFQLQPISSTNLGLETEIPIDQSLRKFKVPHDRQGHFEVPLNCMDSRFQPVYLRFKFVPHVDLHLEQSSIKVQRVELESHHCRHINLEDNNNSKSQRVCFINNQAAKPLWYETSHFTTCWYLPRTTTLNPSPPTVFLKLGKHTSRLLTVTEDMSHLRQRWRDISWNPEGKQVCGLIISQKRDQTPFLYDPVGDLWNPMLLSWRLDPQGRELLEICKMPNHSQDILNNDRLARKDFYWPLDRSLSAVFRKDFLRGKDYYKKFLRPGETFSQDYPRSNWGSARDTIWIQFLESSRDADCHQWTIVIDIKASDSPSLDRLVDFDHL